MSGSEGAANSMQEADWPRWQGSVEMIKMGITEWIFKAALHDTT